MFSMIKTKMPIRETETIEEKKIHPEICYIIFWLYRRLPSLQEAAGVS